MTAIHFDLKLDKICRGCLSETEALISMFESNPELELDILKMFEICTSLQITENDGFSTKICNDCMVRLKECYQFRQMCVQSDFNMRALKSEEIGFKNEIGILTDSNDDKLCNDQENIVYEEYINDEEEKVKYHFSKIMCEDEEGTEKNLDDNPENNVNNYYECDSCSEKFETFRDLKQHEFDLHMPGKMCTICNKTLFTVDEVMNHSRKHLRKSCSKSSKSKKYQCESCNKEYTNSHNLKIHMYSHSGVKPFTCKECGKSFTKINALNSHLSLHTGYWSYLCSECGKGYSTATGLRRHKISHSGERPYKCKICLRSFTASGDLNVHMRCHTGEKPYLCPTCGKAFSRVSHLNTHARTHTGEKPYKCTRCDKGFAQSGDLKSHERTHTGERPYACSQCKKTFVQSSGLASHMRTHTGEKLYKCKICCKAFSQGSSLSRHIRCHNA